MNEPRRLGSSYLLEELIGSGAMGEVWRGDDAEGLDRAFKLLRPEYAQDHKVVERFVQERSILTSVRHPNVVAVHDLVAEGTTMAIVMDLVDGSDLRGVLRRYGTLTPARAAQMAAGIAAGLAAVHQAGIVHRDLKPENVLVDVTGERPTPRLSDFGISKLVDDGSSTRTSMILGTPQYIAPEISDGAEATSASDLYALGVVLYEMCCGITPFASGSTWAVIKAHAESDPGRPEGVPDPLWDLITWLMSKVPRDRPTAERAQGELEGIRALVEESPAAPRVAEPPAPVPSLHGQTTTMSPRPTQPMSSPQTDAQDTAATSGAARANEARPRKRGKVIAAVAAGVVALGVAGAAGAIALLGGDPDEANAQAADDQPVDPADDGSGSESPGSSSSGSGDPTSTSSSTSATPTTMPDFVGGPLSKVETTLPDGTTVESVDVLDEEKTDGTVISQIPAAGDPIGDEVTVKVARQPVTVYLDSMEPVESLYGDFESNDVNGTTLTHALTMNVEDGYPASVEYNLGRNFRRLQGTIGLSDTAEDASATVNFEVYADGRKIYDKTVGLGESVEIDLDVTDCLRLRLSNQYVAGSEDWSDAPAVWGGIRLLGVPGEVPLPTATE